MKRKKVILVLIPLFLAITIFIIKEYNDFQNTNNSNLPSNSAQGEDRNLERSLKYVNVKEFNEALTKGTYEKVSIARNGERYYKIINGIKTNDYYDVYYDEGNINRIEKSDNTILQSDEVPNLKTAKSSEGLELDDDVIDYKVDYVYVKDQDNVRLIKSEYITHQSPKGHKTLDQIYTDVVTGENISFDDFYNFK